MFAAPLDVKGFHCSNGWIDQFKKRHDLIFKTIVGQKGEINSKRTSNWSQDVFPTLVEGYKPEDIYNADETGFFYQLLPSKTLASKEDASAGTKTGRQRVTLLLGANFDGSDRQCPYLLANLLIQCA